MDMLEKLLTTAEVAEIAGCSKPTVTRWAHRLSIGRQFGNQFVFTRAEALQIKKSKQAGPGNPEFGKTNYWEKKSG